MNITLISLYSNITAFGIRTLSACLKKKGHSVSIILLRENFWDEYRDNILSEVVELSKGSDLIGLSLMTNFFDNAIQVTQKIKQNLSTPVAWGGIHPTIRPEECLDYADMVCIGEGEETLTELIKKMEIGETYHDVQGMWFKENGKIIKNKIRPLIQDLDSIPFPDYGYESHYIQSDGHIHRMNESLLERYLGETYMTIATRGCFHTCTYCCNNLLNKMYSNQRIVRKRSINNIMNELKEVKKTMTFINTIWFEDDSFFEYNAKEISDFSVKYKKDVGLILKIHGISPLTVTREKLKPLVNAGLQRIRMGVQTGNDHAKKLYKRYCSNQQIEKAVKLINEFKDKIKVVTYDIILDNPWETDKDLVETLRFLSRFPTPYAFNFFSLTFYPGIELYDMAKKEGMITDERNDIYRRYFHNWKKTYLNNLFFLLNEYARKERKIPPKIMFLLTNRYLRKTGISWLLYLMLKVQLNPFNILLQMQNIKQFSVLKKSTIPLELINLLGNADEVVRAKAMREIEHLGDITHAPYIIGFLKDFSISVRFATLSTLANLTKKKFVSSVYDEDQQKKAIRLYKEWCKKHIVNR
ncbi:MAG: radical SAM protein [Candidatus Omnitrophota bacterium]|jgi:radical SAM superfamily enzyme YgiQ (UPF0313 family)